MGEPASANFQYLFRQFAGDGFAHVGLPFRSTAEHDIAHGAVGYLNVFT
jgi:hypothetical protein